MAVLGVGQVDIHKRCARAPQSVKGLVIGATHALVDTVGDNRAGHTDAQSLYVTGERGRKIWHGLRR